MKNTGLILEGGGMRGVYTSGILQFFMENELWFPYIIGVSMGACNAANYVSRQTMRNKIVNISFVNDPRYISYKRLLFRGELFGMDFIFNTIPNSIELFDYTAFFSHNCNCITVVTNCKTGQAEYYGHKELGNSYMKILQASSSLPFIQKPVFYKGEPYMDGGLSDSVPIRKSESDGNTKNVIILTQPNGYRKKIEPLAKYAALRYPAFPGLQTTLRNRHIMYNETMDYIEEAERTGRVFVIRPQQTLAVGRVERDKQKLYAVYDIGYKDAAVFVPALKEYLQDN
ncbi:MAG: patatin family protein [Ignavibacteria bacterium]|nr:patatin family protein [Ignavibacteria bacterium]